MFPAPTRTSPLPSESSPADATGQPTRLGGDRLGERWLLDDPAHGPMEVLKFKKTYAESPEFEMHLRRRVEELRALRHPGLAVPQSVEWLDHDENLGLVGPHVPGRRLTDLVTHARGAGFALEFLRQLSPALCALQNVRPGVAHGTLTTDRIIVLRDGRLVIRDLPLAPAIEAMSLTPDLLRREVGIAVPDSLNRVHLDQRLDVVQMGMIALALALGRVVNPEDFRAGIPGLLDELSDSSDTSVAELRPWLERALQVAERPFECALDAFESLSPPTTQVVLPFRGAPGSGERPRPDADTRPDLVAPARPPAEPTSAGAAAEREPDVRDGETSRLGRRRVRLGVVHWLVVVLTVVASVEAMAIAELLSSRPLEPLPPAVTVTAPLLRRDAVVSMPTEAAGLGPNDTTLGTTTAAPMPAVALALTAASSAPAARPAEPPRPSTAAGQIGGIRVAVPLTCQIFEGGNLIGTSAGPLALSAGNHDLEFVNDAVGVRIQQSVTVKPGQLTPVTVTLPNGRVNVNAAPWASVWIDGTAAGETPLANLALPVGTHEFVFRHPQLGEQRLAALVKADGVTRVSASFQR